MNNDTSIIGTMKPESVTTILNCYTYNIVYHFIFEAKVSEWTSLIL